MNEQQWVTAVLPKIADNLIGFYERFFPDTSIVPVGVNIRLNPCPICGHNDCCTITPGKVAVNCFRPDCNARGSHLQLLDKVYGHKVDILKVVGDLYGVPYNMEDIIAAQKIIDIRNYAVDFYNNQLLNDVEALTYQLSTRGHNIELLRAFKVGYTTNYFTLRDNLLGQGYTSDEIKSAKVWFPDGLFLYPYKNNRGEFVRFNTKNPFNRTFKDSDKPINGYSIGPKVLYESPYLDKSYVILVEGENDAITVYSMGGRCVRAVGGNFGDSNEQTMLRDLDYFDVIYTMFDNDDAGKAYEEKINNLMAHKPVYKINYGTEYKDPDDAFRKGKLSATMEELIANATLLETAAFTIRHNKELWSISTRSQRLEFNIVGLNKSGNLVGNISFYNEDSLEDRSNETTLAKYRRAKPLNFNLETHMEDYYNENLESRDLETLLEIYVFTKYKNYVVKRIAYLLNQPTITDTDRAKFASDAKVVVGSDVTDIIFKELNDLQNKEVVAFAEIPKMKIGQFFSMKYNEAFMYFTYVTQDGDTIRKLPYLVCNDKSLIRLDLYQRKDEQCVLLVRNKYELPIEVPQAIMELQNTSLSQNYVESYVNGELDIERELNPKLIIREMEAQVRRFYYFPDSDVYKVIALWIYGTYCYKLFGQYPYLFLNGPKGSGKSSLDTVILALGFNAKMAVSITPAALFRTVSIEGGTLILDEMETLTDRKKAAESDLAAVLKGGYSSAGVAIRCDKDNGNQPVAYDVFCPKVISNIFGIEDVIGDRCIAINTLEAPKEVRRRLEDPKEVFVEEMDKMRALTSRAALSVLEHFQYIYSVYRNKVFDANNARLAQILRPLQTLAFIAGPDYETAFNNYYTDVVAYSKQDVERLTPEGALKEIINNIALEIMGKQELNYLDSTMHKYTKEIDVDLSLGKFTIDTIHLKTFLEESLESDNISMNDAGIYLARVYPISLRDRKTRTTLRMTNEALIRENKNNHTIKGYRYDLYLTDLFSEDFVNGALAELEEQKAKEESVDAAISTFLPDDEVTDLTF